MINSLNDKSGFRRTVLTSKIVELIKSEIPIKEVVGEFTDLRKSNDKYIGECPFCDEGLSSLSVYPEYKTYNCSRCLKNGDVFQFIMDIDEVTFRDALKIILSRYAGL